MARSNVLHIETDALTMDETLQLCGARIAERQSLVIGCVNAAKLVKMQTDRVLRNAVVGCDRVLADGMAVVWASRILGNPLPERVAGIDLFMQLLALADRRGHSVYLLGATEEVLDGVVEQMAAQFPGARVAGRRNGYFRDEEGAAVAHEIRKSQADMLFVAMSVPRKELFLAKYGREVGVPVCHGVGGSFDVLAGKVTRAPEAWRGLGLEWLHRVFQEPRRMWKRYLATNTQFAYLMLRTLLGFPRPLR